MIRQSDTGETSGGVLQELGDEITVTLDRWSAGQLDVGDLIVAGAVLVGGAVLAWLASRLARRLARRHDGPVRTAIATFGLLLASAVMLLAAALTLEVLGFSLGPVLVLILVVVVALLVLRPMMTNLSSGLLLQVRGAIEAGDVVLTNGVLGRVLEINARTVVIDTDDGRQVHLPSSVVLDGIIENYTAHGVRRSSVGLLLDASADLDRLSPVLAEAVGGAPGVLDEPAPEVRTDGVAGRYVVVNVFVWHEPGVDDARIAVDEATRAAVAALGSNDTDVVGPDLMLVGGRS